MPELLPAAPRVIVALAVHSQRTFRWLCLLVFVAALGSLVLFWPILIKEDFEAYLQCDGPQHGRLHLLREVKKQAAHPHGRLLQVPRERSVAKYFVRLIYATGDGDNIFTPKYLHLIREIERRVQRLPSFHRFCLAGDRGRCQPPLSVINYFFATVNGATGAMVPDGQGSKLLPIQSILASLGTSNSYFVDRYFGVSQSQLQAALEGNITRSVLRFGLPLRGFSNLQDHQQFELFSQFVRDELRPTLVEATSEELKVFFYGDAITQVEVEATVWHDAAYATGSLAFIFLYLVFYLRSLWLTIMALFCIALCFPISYACYCLVYGHGKMIAINFLSLFVVLGVGADDVFVLHDVWFLTKGHGTGEMALARRMWSMYCKAGMAIFATSATTAASFFANLASSIGPLRQFGFFMGTCITVNWIIVATLYPLVLVNHERSQGPLEVALEEQLVDGSPTDAEEKTSPGRAEKHGATCKGRREAAGVIALLGVGASLFALTTAVHQLRPSNGLPQFFPKDSNLGGLQELQLRFGNETSVNMQEMAMCNGQVQTFCRPRDLPSLPLPRPSVKPSRPARPSRPGRPSGRPQPPPPQQPRPVTSAPTQGPRRPLSELGEDYNVRLRVQGPADPQELEVLREKILTALKLKPEDLEFEVQAVPDGSGRRLEELEVTLHFQHLSTQQEHQIQDFLKQNQELLQAFGAKDVITTVPPSRATEPMPELMPEPTPQAKTSSLTVARTTTPPTRPTTRRPTTVEHPATTRAPTTPRSPSASTLTTTFPVLHLQKRGMAKDRQAQVFVVFGFRQVPGSYHYVLDDSFDLSAREAQLAVVEFCKLLRLEKALKVVPGVGNCWPEKMKMYMNMRHLPWPTYNFFPALQRFVRESEKWVGEHVGMDQGAVQWCQMDFNVEVDIWSSGRQVQPYMDLWDETVSRVLRAASEKYPGSAAYLGSPVPVSDLFQRAEAENRVVNSALSSWVVSVGCALVALAFFTRSCWLSGLACFAMLSTAACSLFFITSVFHWSFGLMEAVSLIIFCGFSVDYPLHVVQAYVQERQKGAHIRHALREVGSAVASGCVTTCGAALFLLFCQIRIFTRFGQVLVVNMLCSLIFALLWIPAVLELCRPNVTPVSKDEEGFAMGLLGESAGSAGRRSTPGPSARDDRLMLEMEESEAGGFSALQG